MAAQRVPTETLLRRGLVAITACTIVGLTLELIAERHWTKPTQLIGWAALALAAVGVGLLFGRPTKGRVRLAQALALLVTLSAIIGIWQHIAANHEAGVLDYRYAQTWETMSSLARWWTAARKGVGPAPPLAPGALALVGLCTLLATLRHPALTDSSR